MGVRGCYWTEGPGANPAVGGRDPPAQQALQGCLSAAGEPSVCLSSLVASAQVCWVCLSMCLLFSEEEWLCPAEKVMPVSLCHASRRFSLDQLESWTWIPSVSLEDSSCQVLHMRKTVPSCLLPSGTSKGKYQTTH